MNLERCVHASNDYPPKSIAVHLYILQLKRKYNIIKVNFVYRLRFSYLRREFLYLTSCFRCNVDKNHHFKGKCEEKRGKTNKNYFSVVLRITRFSFLFSFERINESTPHDIVCLQILRFFHAFQEL